MPGRRYLITAALPYSNGRPHVGSLGGAHLPADIYVRFLRARGEEVLFVCGSDDNGVANLIAACSEGTTPEEVSTRYNAAQQDDFAGLGIDFDEYGGTHRQDCVELHTQMSQQFFLKMHQNGCFVKRTSKQLYDTKLGKFISDRYVRGRCYHRLPDGTDCEFPGAHGDQCEHCGNSIEPIQLINPISTITGTTPIPKETTHWYLKLDAFRDRLRDWHDSHPEWRSTVLDFAHALLEEPLPERAMTRDLEWGVPLPLDDPDAEGKVLYVWFDAPIGYVTFTALHCARQGGDIEGYRRWWKDPECRIVHFIGEDNTLFHALIWPAMLMAEGSFQLPHNVVANSFLNIKLAGRSAEKISKSRGSAIWIADYLAGHDPDPLRYYLTRIAPEAQRTTFDVKEFVTCNNTELVDTLQEFLTRTVSVAQQDFDGQVPPTGQRSESDQALLVTGHRAVEQTTEHLENCRFKDALAEVMNLAREGRKYLDTAAPDRASAADSEAAGRAVNVSLQTARTLTTLLGPFLPFTAGQCLQMLSLDQQALEWSRAGDELPAGHALGKPQTLFRSLDSANTLGPNRLPA